MNGRRFSKARESVIGPWDGPFFLVCLAFFVCAILLGEKGTPTYAKMNGGLFTLSVAAAALFVLRVRLGFGQMPSLWTWPGWIAYAKSGQLALDLFFALDALALVFVLDLRFWRGYGVKIGAVAGIALLKLAISSFRSCRR